MDDYRYELKYIYNGIETVVTSRADINIDQMKELLRHFCKCSGWSNTQINYLIKDNDVDSN